MNNNNKKIVFEILQDEIRGDVQSALQKLAPGYTMTWMYRGKNGQLFPRGGPDVRTTLPEIYAIKGREYDVRNVAEGEDVVMVEMVESYPDPDTGEIYRTPLVIVLEMRESKIARGRHYCDPALSHAKLTSDAVDRAYQ